MKKVGRGITFLMVCLMVLALFPVQASAAGLIMPDRDVTVTMTYEDGDKAVPNALFNIYRVADVSEYARMTLTPAFEPYRNSVLGLSDLENMDSSKWLLLASTLKGYVQRDNLMPAAADRTDAEGRLAFTLKPGLYLVLGYPATTEDFYTYTATPFMLFLPGQDVEKNDWSYAVTVSPKFEKSYYPPEEPDPVVTRKVLKIWDDKGYESIRPESVVVQLLKDGSVYDTQTLNEANSWRYAWDNLEGNHEWTIVEQEMPDYAALISRNGITFTVRNKFIAPVTTGDPPVQKCITGDPPKNWDTFTFVMTAKDPSFPMPEGSTDGVKEVSIVGAGWVEFGDITFTKAGVYTYLIYEKNNGVDGYTYDSRGFIVTYDVKLRNGVLEVYRSITNTIGTPYSVIEFTNVYKTPPERLPQTGLLWWPVAALLIAGCSLVTGGIIIRRKYKK